MVNKTFLKLVSRPKITGTEVKVVYVSYITVVEGGMTSVAVGLNFLLILTVKGRCVLETTPRAPESETNTHWYRNLLIKNAALKISSSYYFVH